MAIHREEARFTVTIDLSAEFPDDYEGDDDGNEWLRRWSERVRPKLVRAIFEALRADPAFEAIPAPRGRAPDEHVEIDVRFRP